MDAHQAAEAAVEGRQIVEPGLREDYGANYHATFALDPDGYRLEAYCD